MPPLRCNWSPCTERVPVPLAGVTALVVLVIMLQQAVAEVVVEVAINAVNVIGVILSVVVFDQERRALNEIVVRLAGLEAAGPNEMDVVDPGTVDSGKVL